MPEPTIKIEFEARVQTAEFRDYYGEAVHKLTFPDGKIVYLPAKYVRTAVSSS